MAPHNLDSRSLGARRVQRLGDSSGYATVAMTTKRVLDGSAPATTVPHGVLSRSKLILSAAAQAQLAEPVQCTVRHEPSGESSLLVAEFELPAGPRVWVEVDAVIAASDSGSLHLRCNLDSDSDSNAGISWSQPIAIPIVEDPAPPLIVLVSLDTLRSDRVGGFGGTREMTPNLTRIGDEGLRLLGAFSDSTWTSPSHRVLMTGGLSIYLDDFLGGAPSAYLASELASHGYTTIAITDGGYLAPHLGHHLGFDHFRAPPDVESLQQLEEQIVLVEEWIERTSDAPLFLFLHTYAVHRPGPAQRKWTRSHLVRDRFNPKGETLEAVKDYYDMSVRFTDDLIGKLLESLRRTASRRPVLLVIVSDHGQSLGEHGVFGHGPGTPIHDELTMIPIIVWSPGNIASGSTLFQPTTLVDIAPSILGAIGIPAPSQMFGSNHWPLWSGTSEESLSSDPGSVSHHNRVWSIRTRERRLIVSASKDGELGFELYDLAHDADGRLDIASKHPRIVAKMREDMMARLAALGMPENRQGYLKSGNSSLPPDLEAHDHPAAQGMDDAVRDQLRALGYVN